MTTIAAYRDLHAGASIVVCGCGSSLSTLKEPKQFLTIGVNDVGRLFDPDYLVVVNHRREFRDGRFQYVEQSRARVLFTQLDLRIAHPNVVRFRLGQRGGTDFSDPNVLHYARNSPYVATCLAAHMGAKRIGLIGVDFTEHHFFGKTGVHPLQRELGQIDSEYRRLREALLAAGIELVNLSAESRLASLPKWSIDEFAEAQRRDHGLRIVSYATTPVAGVPAILARCISERTPHEARCVWETERYGNGVVFQGDVEWSRSPAEAARLIEEADAVVVHNGKVAARHRPLLEAKPVLTLAHNYAWNVDPHFTRKGLPGLVVGQYQATLPELAGWTAVPNPISLAEFGPAPKDDVVTIAYTPSGKHERYPTSHRLYWHSKGYETTMRVLDALARRYPLRIEAIRDKQVTHAESLTMKQRAHIVIDECVTGSYHRNSLEGLAYGCVVVNGIGILPEVERVFRACAPESEEIPFVPARLETLEEVLQQLIELGPAELASRGAANRAWMERHWDFAAQWTRIWQPAVDAARRMRAMPAARPVVAAVTPPPPVEPTARATADRLADVTIVVPCGGEERLRNLRTVVATLREAKIANVILAESDAEPRAAAIAAEAGYGHLFVPRDGVYHKARVMNEGAGGVRTSRFIWLDADLLVTRRFLEQAVAEAESLGVDCLVPWTSVRYLSETDSAAVAEGTKTPDLCTPVNTYLTRQGCRGGIVVMKTEFFRRFGGVCEEFRGWGGEDNAFFHKASVLGRAAPTRRVDQHAWHLWHPLSGGYGPPEAMAANPHYARNLALANEIRTLRTREQFLARFPLQAPCATVAPACPAGPAEIDLLFLAWNRLEFTQASFETLLRNTEWPLVHELFVWDDGSTDGTKEWLREAMRRLPSTVKARFVETALRSPVAVMSRFIESASAAIVAKVDNDVLLPPQWLSEAAAVMARHSELHFLGIEAMRPVVAMPSAPRTYARSPFVSGLALYRRSAFAASRPAPVGPWFGFEEWQRAQNPRLVAGWIDPALPVALLDRIPLEPWRSHTTTYEKKGWQRRWPAYPMSASSLWSWWSDDPNGATDEVPFDVVIPSGSARNLVACVKALYECEPRLDPSHIIVVDDGARANAEAELPGVRWIEGVPPFVFARNTNLGIAASKRDVILLNDDALLITPGGLQRLAATARARADAGIVAASVRGVVGNANQRARRGSAVRLEPRQVCFIAAYLRRDVIEAVGPLDERFVGYGFDDDDYSQRVRETGRVLLVDDGCVVEHGTLPSAFRTRPDYPARFAQNRRLFAEKTATPPAHDAAPVTGSSEVLCVMRVKNEAAQIHDVLSRALTLCARAVVFDDHSDDETASICRSFAERVRVIASPFSGVDEARDKNYILGVIRELAPAWVLWIDGDEVLERAGAGRLRQIIDHASADTSVFTLRVSYLWDAEDRVRIDGIWGRFRRASLFRWRGQRVEALAFPEKKAPNLHCGNVPRGITGHTRHADVRLKHYGYLDPQMRQEKYRWYTTIDPNNTAEDQYRHLAGIAGARHAPGPPVFVPWTE